MKFLTQILLTILLVVSPAISQAVDSCTAGPGIKAFFDEIKSDPELAKAIKKNVDLVKVWKDLEDSGEPDLNNDPEILEILFKIPSSIEGNFPEWFDKLSVDQVNTIWKNTELQNAIKRRLRHPGGLHEWCMVCRAPIFKEWGVTVAEIHDFRTETKKLVWIHPDDGKPGGHDNSAPGGKHGSTKFHNELKSIIDNSSALAEFNTKLEALRIRWKIDKSLLPPFI